jgi:hypothetical protein
MCRARRITPPRCRKANTKPSEEVGARHATAITGGRRWSARSHRSTAGVGRSSLWATRRMSLYTAPSALRSSVWRSHRHDPAGAAHPVRQPPAHRAPPALDDRGVLIGGPVCSSPGVRPVTATGAINDPQFAIRYTPIVTDDSAWIGPRVSRAVGRPFWAASPSAVAPWCRRERSSSRMSRPVVSRRASLPARWAGVRCRTSPTPSSIGRTSSSARSRSA